MGSNNGERKLSGENLCALIHGDGGTGKSWLGQTTPTPRLVLDAEGGSRSPKRMVDGAVVKQRKVSWDPTRDAPPAAGDWDTCHVAVRDFQTVNKAFEWLLNGAHPFKSVVLDSLTEIQKRCKDSISGTETPAERDWGLMLIRMEHLVRAFRDLVFHPTNPLDAVVILALTQDKNGKRRPAVQGALGVSLPGYVDLEGYLFVQTAEDGTETRRLLIHPRDGFEAKDRTHTLTQVYGAAIDEPDVETMLAILNNEGDN
jgi:hypothetical protein